MSVPDTGSLNGNSNSLSAVEKASSYPERVHYASQLLNCTKPELVARILSNDFRMEESLCQKLVHDANASVAAIPSTVPTKVRRPMDWSRQEFHRVALRVAYVGVLFRGFAAQPSIKETVEEYLLHALEKLYLIQSRQLCNLSKCGRTDKGVSATGNVISVDIRKVVSSNERTSSTSQVIQMLNRVLPVSIRITGAVVVGPTFSARFSCRARTYKYLLFDDSLDLDAMQTAASSLQGRHDFRNFCKIDLRSVQNFERCIFKAQIEPFHHRKGDVGGSESDVWCFTVSAEGFLYHQVRMIVTVLLLVGRGLESPAVVSEMLDVQKVQGKPDYPMASEIPLILYECEFDEVKFEADLSSVAYLDLLSHLRVHCRRSHMNSMIWHMIYGSVFPTADSQAPSAQELPKPELLQVDDRRVESKVHVPLLKRKRGKTMEQRIEMLSDRDRKVFEAKRSRILLFRRLSLDTE